MNATLAFSLAYLVLALVTCRIAFVIDGGDRESWKDNEHLLLVVGAFWPFALLSGVAWCFYRVVTLPTSKQRKERRLASARETITRLERELNIGGEQ